MPRVIIFANGVLDPSVTTVIKTSDIILCADGGANHALSLGLTPHAVIGDFDSLSRESLALLKTKNVELHQFSVDKDESDLELALGHALTLNPSEIILVCALGNRLDQMLGNILHLGHIIYSDVAMSLIDGDLMGRVVHATNELRIHANPGDALSLIPLRPNVSGVTLSGVKWPLDNTTLLMGDTLSISNQFVDATAKLSIAQGAILLTTSRLARFDLLDCKS